MPDNSKKTLYPSVTDGLPFAMDMINHGMPRERVAEYLSFLAGFNGALEEQKRLATLDTLTELPNRRGLKQAFNHVQGVLKREDHDRVTNRANTEPAQGALVFFDVVGLKKVNDDEGFDKGDAMIKSMASGLRHVFHRSTDTVGRLGGDEFVAVLDHTDPTYVATQMKEKLADMQTKLQVPLASGLKPFGFRFNVASFGVNDNFDATIDRADPKKNAATTVTLIPPPAAAAA
jgi:diguanylate cyclase (GGDEF)-like protein